MVTAYLMEKALQNEVILGNNISFFQQLHNVLANI